MAKPTPGVWGLDLGQCALKALRLQEIEGVVTATAFDYVEYPKILSQPDADPDQLTREALEQFLSRNVLRGDVVCIAVPGQSGLARFVKLPPVEEKKIADIVKFEAKQQIPFNLDEVVWSFQKLGSGMVVDGFALETEIGLFAMKRDMIKRYIDHFKEVKVEIHVIQMAPLALCNFLAYDMLNKEAAREGSGGEGGEDKGPCVAGLDLGTDSSNLVVTDGGRVIWQRPIPLGGNHFTRALTKELKLTFAKAEHLKRNATKSGAADLKKILGALKPVLNDFVGEVQRSLGFFTNTHKDANIEYMVGLGNAFRLPGLQRFLAEKLGLEVRKLDKMNRLIGDACVSAPIYQENILSFGVAYGLALQGIKRARLITNLLPPEIHVERLVRAKKPWMVAAAGVLAFGLAGGALGKHLEAMPYVKPNVLKSMADSDAVDKRASGAAAKYTKIKSDANAEAEAVKSIIAGDGERVNWIALMKFISDAIPQPDGKNLPSDKVGMYWEQRPTGMAGILSGAEAFEEYKRWQSQTNDKPAPKIKEGETTPLPAVDLLPPGIESLVQFNINSIDARFTDDLGGYWKKAKATRTAADVAPEEQWDKNPPEGKGWVVEITGYTYHRDQAGFVRRTLLKKIAELGLKAPAKTAEAEPKAKDPVPPPAKDKLDDKIKEKDPGLKDKDGPKTPDKDKTPDKEKDADKGKEPAPQDPPPEGAEKSRRPEHPVRGLVSHVLLRDWQPKKTNGGPSPYEIITNRAVDTLLGGGAAGSGGPGLGGGRGGEGSGMPPAAMGGQGGGTGGGEVSKTRAGWRPLSTRGGGAATTGGGGLSAPPIGGIGGLQPKGGEGGGVNPTPLGEAGKYTRTEFVILFIWKEHTPSDGLRGGVDSETEAGAAGGEAGGGMPPMGR